jgi:methionyl-tRNA synthetase
VTAERASTIITAALPYANADLHLGHVASTHLPPDILYRYLKLRGRDVVQLCASDDFGTPILLAAEREGKSPAEYVAGWNKEFRRDLEDLQIVYDLFDRTSSPENVALVQEFFRKLDENGFIFRSEVDQFYCEKDKKFLPDRYVRGKCPYCGAEDQYSDGCENCGRTLQVGQILTPKCAICGTPPVYRKSVHSFFKLSAFADRLTDWLGNNRGLQADAVNYVMNWIGDGLKDWDVTRDLNWGVPVPLEEAAGQVLYGWFDNHLCYITMGSKIAKQRGMDPVAYWNGSELYHFIGKDIVYHHYLFLPSMRMGEGRFKLPDSIPTRGHLLIQGKKISKSRHWTVTIKDFLKLFPADYLRFYLTRVVPYSQADADLEWEDFKDKINGELVANIGNFAYRALSFVAKEHGGTVPEPGVRTKDDEALLAEVAACSSKVAGLIDDGHFDRALKAVLDLSTKCNQYFQHRAPWQNKAEEPNTIFYSCNMVADLAIMLQPFMPSGAERIWKQLGMSGTIASAGWDALSKLNVKPGSKLGPISPPFKRIEESDVKAAQKLVG